MSLPRELQTQRAKDGDPTEKQPPWGGGELSTPEKDYEWEAQKESHKSEVPGKRTGPAKGSSVETPFMTFVLQNGGLTHESQWNLNPTASWPLKPLHGSLQCSNMLPQRAWARKTHHRSWGNRLKPFSTDLDSRKPEKRKLTVSKKNAGEILAAPPDKQQMQIYLFKDEEQGNRK